MDLDKNDGEGSILIGYKRGKGMITNRSIKNLNSMEIEQIIGKMEVIKSELVDLNRELIKRDNESKNQ